MYATETAEHVPCTEQQGQSIVGPWLDAAGLGPDAWPLDTEQAALVLFAAGYDVDVAELERLGRMGQSPSVAAWDAKDLICAAAAFESRRQWQLAPSPHDGKKHSTRLMLEAFLAEGEKGLAEFQSRFKKFDLRFAIILLVEAENREVRERMFSVVTGLLAARGVEL